MAAGTDNIVPVVDTFLKIPAADGRVLAARLWRPEGDGCWPLILEFSPYRIWDLFRSLHEMTFPYWAERGYAVVTVDIAGSGGSTGLLHDEYLPSELDDAIAVIDWCAAQDWCDGNAGLSGLSWAAFTALRVSDRKPKALKAMVLGAVSDDGWLTDVHYLGGVPYTAQADWAGVMLMFNALPPDPEQYGKGWRDAWLARLDANKPWLIPWLTHSGHDAYWKDKAARFESDVPLLLYSGSADKYATSVLRIAEHWKGPVRTIIGPWDHTLPNLSPREPRIGFLQEALRWWDRWLKGHDTGAMGEAPLRVWVAAYDSEGKAANGAWRALDWPLQNNKPLELSIANGSLTPSNSSPEAGWQRLFAMPPMPFQLDRDLYEDVPARFADDPYSRANAFMAVAKSMTHDIDIVGMPVVRCTVRASDRIRPVIARLIDESRGSEIRVATGALALGPGEETEVEIPLQACAWRLKAGHTLTLVLYAGGMPTFWSVPHDTETHVRDIRLTLPALTAKDGDVRFADPVAAEASPTAKLKWIDRSNEPIAWPPREHTTAREAATAAHHLTATGTDYFITSRFEITHNWAAKSYRIAFERPGFSIRIDTRLEVSSTPDAFHINWQVRANEGGRIVRDISDERDVPPHEHLTDLLIPPPP